MQKSHSHLVQIVLVITTLASMTPPCLGQLSALSESSVLRLDNEGPESSIRWRSLTVEVGDSTRPAFEPSFRLTGWSGSGQLKVHLSSDRFPLSMALRQVSLRNDHEMTRLVTPSLDHELFVRPDGSFEWQMVFKSRPDTNVFDFPVETEGLAFHYQDELTEAEILAGSYRPDSVVGSYAVYLAEGRGNRVNRAGTVFEFGTGKLCHVYRPKAWDAVGDTVWCGIDINVDAQLLRLAVPGEFLERATYPVVIDPTFGVSSVGASDFSLGAGHVRHCRFGMGSTGGTADSITVYISEDGSTSNVGTAIYTDASGCASLVDSSDQEYTTTAWNAGWISMPVSAGATLSASTNYYLSGTSDATSCIMKYDDTDSGSSTGHWSDPWPFDTDCSNGWNNNDYTFSIYVTYTESGGTGPSGRRRRQVAGGY
jgi:hypothetical protein